MNIMKLDDKIKGAVYGMALGDALGIGTEFMTRREVQFHYPEGLTRFDQFIKDAHRVMFERGEWSNDTDVILVMLESLLEKKEVSPAHMAKCLKKWFDSYTGDIVSIYRVVMTAPGWEDNPIAVAHNVWEDKLYSNASNECLNRALVIAIMSKDTSVVPLAQKLVGITHDDSRCTAATATLAVVAKHLLYFDEDPDFNYLLKGCRNVDERVVEFLRIARFGDFGQLDIDNPDTLWYVRKSMASALWALWHLDSPGEILSFLVHAGGDTDTNASAAMILAGLKYGYEALPPIKEEIAGRERLDDISARLTEFIKTEIL